MIPSALKNKLIQSFPHEPTEGQSSLMEQLASFITYPVSDTIFLLCGYAGTGKTSVVISLVKVLPEIGGNFVLLAPTGRAAKVLSGYSGKKAHTIHRYIYLYQTSGDGITKIIRQQNKNRDTLFVVDEASMIQGDMRNDEFSVFSSRNLLEDLIQYVFEGENCKLLLIGDTAQLPPVGTDVSPALDEKLLEKSFGLKVRRFELTEVVRQQENSGILMNATLLRQQISKKKIRLPFFNIGSCTDVFRITGPELEEALNKSFSGGNQADVCVVCRSNKRANLFNMEIRTRILGRENEISAGDYLMIVKNSYFWLPPDSVAGFIANGDIVEILKIKRYIDLYGYRFADVTIRLMDYPDEKPLEVKIILDTLMLNTPCLPFEENKKLFEEVLGDYEDIPSRRNKIAKVKLNPFYNALQVKYAYSFTCHKTQGGQWNTVFIDQGYLTRDKIDMEYLRWLYTALTRGVKEVYFVNFSNDFFNS